ncbi:MAG TPA: M24 family metallopeptidase [Steroidobacteraceae bacterium]|nr:M24 family metallopeptidase [Steroidobacteraceae bacterium]
MTRLTRRQALQAGLLGAACAAAPGPAAAGRDRPVPADLSFLRDSPLMDGDRARFFMRQEGMDALVVAQPANVFYVSNHWPQLARMGYTHTMFAVLARDPARPIALVLNAFGYYYSHSDETAFTDRIVYTYTQADGSAAPAGDGDPPAVEPQALRIVDEALVTPRERRRRQMLAGIQGNHATAAGALVAALRELGLEKAALGTDDPAIEAILRPRGIEGRFIAADDTLRRIRLAKSPAELRLMRLAAQRNVEAAFAAARFAREAGSTRALRARFMAEAALRGNIGTFMVIDRSSSEVMDWPLRDGMSVSIDCVSTCRNYHGDFGRTIFIGEPREPMRRAVHAVVAAWDELRGSLRAGLRFSEIPRIGREALRKQGADVTVSFRPHSVGLFHTDQPRNDLSQGRTAPDLVLEENMILSVDCPILDAGLGGSAHLEDLMLIRADGAEPIHEIGERVIVV